MRVVWLNNDISPIDSPEGVSTKLLGSYDTSNQHVTIYLIIDYLGTEYRISRYHRRTTVGGNPDKLLRRYAISIKSFTRKYGQAPFVELIKKFLEWSDNPAHEILRSLIHQNEPLDE